MRDFNTVELARKIRLHALRMTSLGGSAHIGPILSMADLVAVLYGKILNVDPNNPKWDKRDRFILSKGHAGAGIYAALAETGFMPVAKLDTHYQNGSDLCGHVSHKGIPGVELSTGSLGHGLSVATGMAYTAKLDSKNHKIYALLGDGEHDEGSTWEAILFAAHHGLDNLVAIVDYNKMQSLTTVEKTLNLEPFSRKWMDFGWAVKEINGHDHEAIIGACLELPFTKSKPSCIIAHTIKGKGVSFMENNILWHYMTAQGDVYEMAKKELESGL